MLLEKIIEIAKAHGWKEQLFGLTGSPKSVGTILHKNGEILSISITEEEHMAYPDEDELKELFGET